MCILEESASVTQSPICLTSMHNFKIILCEICLHYVGIYSCPRLCIQMQELTFRCPMIWTSFSSGDVISGLLPGKWHWQEVCTKPRFNLWGTTLFNLHLQIMLIDSIFKSIFCHLNTNILRQTHVFQVVTLSCFRRLTNYLYILFSVSRLH